MLFYCSPFFAVIFSEKAEMAVSQKQALASFMSKRETVSLIIAFLLDNLYKNSDTLIANLG